MTQGCGRLGLRSSTPAAIEAHIEDHITTRSGPAWRELWTNGTFHRLMYDLIRDSKHVATALEERLITFIEAFREALEEPLQAFHNHFQTPADTQSPVTAGEIL